MKIEKAIEILTYWDDDLNAWNMADTDSAVKLGIEALKAVRKFQSMGSKINPLRLPGETKE